jgi:hypothetical protein
MKIQTVYSDNLDVLVALVTYLAMTDFKSNTPSYIAETLALDINKVKNTLQTFDGLFRESNNPAENGEKYYTLHLRYALRWAQDDDNNSELKEPLGAEYLDTLLNFITRMVEQEQTNQRQFSSNRATLTAAWVAAGVAFLSIICSFTGILISVIVTSLNH